MKPTKFNPFNKYVQCYCDKKEVILLGVGYYFYASILSIILFALLSLAAIYMVIQHVIDYKMAVLPILILALFLLVSWSYYRKFYGEMKKIGHTTSCSKKISFRGTMCQGKGASFKIGVNTAEVDPQGDYGTPTIGLLWLAFFVNLIFITEFSYEKHLSVVYALLFMFSIIASYRLLRKINKPRIIVKVILLMNIFSSTLLLLLYGVYLINGHSAT